MRANIENLWLYLSPDKVKDTIVTRKQLEANETSLDPKNTNDRKLN